MPRSMRRSPLAVARSSLDAHSDRSGLASSRREIVNACNTRVCFLEKAPPATYARRRQALRQKDYRLGTRRVIKRGRCAVKSGKEKIQFVRGYDRQYLEIEGHSGDKMRTTEA